MESYRILELFCEHTVLHALMIDFEKCYTLMDAMNRAGNKLHYSCSSL